jgi:trk system potassium uptake protein TrkA
MRALVIGCGRVGAATALTLDGAGWDVTVIDEDPGVRTRLGDDWRGRFVVGHGMDQEILEGAGIEQADVVIAATDGDNTNIVVGQIARLRYEVGSVAVRIHDPARAEAYAGRGFEVVSPARAAIDRLAEWALGSRHAGLT